MRVDHEQASLGSLISELTQEASTLVRQEVELAKTEVSHTAKRLGKGAGFIGAGAVLGFAGLLAFIATCIILLAVVLKLWIAALIVTFLVFACAGLLALSGLNMMKRESLAPKHTMQTIKEDVEWAKAQKN